MKIQSLSVVVPNPECVNHCRFCVSRMHKDEYKNQMDDNLPYFDLYVRDYIKRLEYARDNGCNTVMLTGSSEPQQNRKFLTYFGLFMQMMNNPFRQIEMQTTGVMLDRDYRRFLRNHVGVNIISLSVSSFNDRHNSMIIGAPERIYRNLAELAEDIKDYDFTLRLSLNLTSDFDQFAECPAVLFEQCKQYGADQVTLRILYSEGETEQAKWVKENAATEKSVAVLSDYVRKCGTKIGILPYGAVKYSVNGLCVVIDDDCMAKNGERRVFGEPPMSRDESYKYLILRPDCKLYSQWDDKASLIF